MESRIAFIYGLVDPRDNRLRYVGKSIRPLERRTNHLQDRSRCHRSNWIRALRHSGFAPKLVVLDVVADGEAWQDAERTWIARAKAVGCDLVNNTSGGDGVPDLPPETRERMRLVWLGRKHRPETIAKLGSSMRGRHHTPEHREKMRRLMSGRVIAWSDKVAEAVRKLTDAECAEIQKRIANGELVKDIAAEYGLHRTTVSKVKAGTYFIRGQVAS